MCYSKVHEVFLRRLLNVDIGSEKAGHGLEWLEHDLSEKEDLERVARHTEFGTWTSLKFIVLHGKENKR